MSAACSTAKAHYGGLLLGSITFHHGCEPGHTSLLCLCKLTFKQLPVKQLPVKQPPVPLSNGLEANSQGGVATVLDSGAGDLERQCYQSLFHVVHKYGVFEERLHVLKSKLFWYDRALEFVAVEHDKRICTLPMNQCLDLP
jgi:hypothetical protein